VPTPSDPHPATEGTRRGVDHPVAPPGSPPTVAALRAPRTDTGHDADGGRMRSLLAAIPDLMVRCRPDGSVIDRKAVGRSEVVPGDGVHLDDLLGPWAVELQDLAAQLDDRTVLRSERPVEIGGEPHHFEARISRTSDEPGFLVLLADVTARRIAEDQIARSERRLQALLAHLADVVLVVDVEGRPTWVSPSVARVLGYTPAEFLERAMLVIHPSDRPALGRVQREALHRLDGTAEAELRIRHADGSWRWMQLIASNRVDDPAIAGFVVTARDLTERISQAEALTHQARHDALTGLPNRVLLLEELTRSTARAERQATRLAVLFLDVDHFKVVNDSLGHAAGDELLRSVAERLRTSVRLSDVVSRFGGDEFVVLCDPVVDEADALRVARRVAVAMAGPFQVEDHSLRATLSIGIAVHEAGSTPSSMLRDADAAAYRAKQRGRDRVELFDATLRAAAQQRLSTENELRRGIAQRHIEAHYQPVVDLTTMQVTGFEALARWRHPTRGLLNPVDFIPVAEETGQIVPLGTQMLRQACHQLAAWLRARPDTRPTSVSINVAARQLTDGGFADLVGFVLDESGAPPKLITLELTESDLVQELDSTAAQLGRLRERGVRVALDDFGAGWSSLGQLRALPIDVVKVDRQFIRSLRDDPAGGAIVGAVVRLAEALDLAVVAEGVETEAELEGLLQLGCREAQGFLFAPALPPDRAGELLGAAPPGR
jgi:diguanylate cyclase (GGDEF)-like protein/PAS domain S-box-containing protein